MALNYLNPRRALWYWKMIAHLWFGSVMVLMRLGVRKRGFDNRVPCTNLDCEEGRAGAPYAWQLRYEPSTSSQLPFGSRDPDHLPLTTLSNLSLSFLSTYKNWHVLTSPEWKRNENAVVFSRRFLIACINTNIAEFLRARVITVVFFLSIFRNISRPKNVLLHSPTISIQKKNTLSCLFLTLRKKNGISKRNHKNVFLCYLKMVLVKVVFYFAS